MANANTPPTVIAITSTMKIRVRTMGYLKSAPAAAHGRSKLRPYCSLRISADAVSVNGVPSVEPDTSSRATGCSTMNRNG